MSRIENTTYHLLHMLLPVILGTIRIYMSATIEEVKDAIGAMEWEAHEWRRENGPANLGGIEIFKFAIKEYKFEPRKVKSRKKGSWLTKKISEPRRRTRNPL